ncbi:phosphoribosyltransferase [Limnobacter litoralis]|uniref:Nucleotide phosphoribosyltransferase n=1 Tax=Limnobacter litoralis TaxID=481366 RepID=A0ABQ5YXV0_9BURK|nr:phosphoribosyltransferase family protein [Limnobacter litoralis]GLR27733.1 nucleotide phosphoribosyltransferase [Limnobacter litoralis]
MEKRFVDYAQYHALVDKVLANVQQANFHPDVVVGVARGGLMLADGLSRGLPSPMAVVMASSYREGSGTQQGQLRISSSVASLSPLQGRVLVADDLVDSGRTLAALLQHLRVAHPGITEVRSAVIWHKHSATFQPDFFAETLDHDLWIVQPFEVRDFR